LFEPLIRETQPYAKKIAHRVEPSLLAETEICRRQAAPSPVRSVCGFKALQRLCPTRQLLHLRGSPIMSDRGCLSQTQPMPKQMGQFLSMGLGGYFCRKPAATLSPLDDRILGPCPGAHRPAAKAHTRGGQYQFERTCPLAAFSEIVQDPIRRIGDEEGCNRGGQAFKHGPRSQFELLRVVPAKISAPF
jgi:hypothetical protein